MLHCIHDSTSNDSVYICMMVLPKPTIFMTASIMTESQHVNVHIQNIIQNRITLNKLQQLIEEMPS